jgi:hypothetical protein
MSNPIPAWISRRLLHLKKTGTFSLAGERELDLTDLSRPDAASVRTICRRLDLSRTTFSSLSGLPYLPRLLTFCGDRSQIASFANFRALRNATSISLKDTPLSQNETYRLSILLAVGTASLTSIDGTQVSPRLKSRAEAFPPVCADLVNAGWVAAPQVPTHDELLELCRQFRLATPAEEVSEAPIPVVPQVRLPSFEDLLAQLKGEHEGVIVRGAELFERAAENEAE